MVRAVAGLLHNFGLLNIAAAQSDFGRSFKKVLKESDKLYMRPQLALSKVCITLNSVHCSVY